MRTPEMMSGEFSKHVERNFTKFEFSFDKDFCDGTAAAPSPGKLKGLELKTFAELDSQTGIGKDVPTKDVRTAVASFPDRWLNTNTSIVDRRD